MNTTALKLRLATVSLLLAGGSLMQMPAVAQTSVATIPVGFSQQIINPALDGTTPVGTVFSVPFYNPPSYSAAISTVDSATMISCASAIWTADQFAQGAAPSLLHFKTGTAIGRYFTIITNSSTQLTVDSRGYDLTTIVAASDKFDIIPANTLGLLFGTSTTAFQTGASASAADNLYLWNQSSATWDVYFNSGTAWYKAAARGTQNNTILYPDEGVFFLRRNTIPLTLTFSGSVPTTNESTDVPGPGSTFISNRFPVSTTLSAIGLSSAPNWQAGPSANGADLLYLWNGTTWSVFFFGDTDSHWHQAGARGTFDGQVIPLGGAIFVIRKSAASGLSATTVQVLPYTL